MMAAIFICIGCIFLGEKAIGKGIVLGALFSVLNFVLIGETLPLTLAPGKKKSSVLSFGFILLRYFLMAVPIFIGIKSETINLFSVAAGLFSVQLMILAEHLTTFFFAGKQKA